MGSTSKKAIPTGMAFSFLTGKRQTQIHINAAQVNKWLIVEFPEGFADDLADGRMGEDDLAGIGDP